MPCKDFKWTEQQVKDLEGKTKDDYVKMTHNGNQVGSASTRFINWIFVFSSLQGT